MKFKIRRAVILLLLMSAVLMACDRSDKGEDGAGGKYRINFIGEDYLNNRAAWESNKIDNYRLDEDYFFKITEMACTQGVLLLSETGFYVYRDNQRLPVCLWKEVLCLVC